MSALAAGVTALTLVTAGVPAHAQRIVYDPTNFSQNVLTAARELQQVNNSIQSLENQANMLINQAKNLASLPYSSLAQLEQSINQTEQLLIQAQRIAYNVTTINQAFTSTYPQAYSSSTSSQQLVANAQTRWQNSLAGFQDAMRVQAGVVQTSTATARRSRAGHVEPVGDRRAPGGPVGKPARRAPDQQLADLTAVMAVDRAGAEPGRRAHVANQAQAQQQLQQLPQLRLGLPARLRADVPLMRAGRSTSPRSAAPPGLSWSPRRSSRPPSSSSSDDARRDVALAQPAIVERSPRARELARCQTLGMAGAE